MPNKEKQGSALLLTTILLFVILSMVISLTYITVMEQKMSGKTKSSVGSFYSAESGIEWALNKIATTSVANPIIRDAFPSISQGKTPCPANFNCEVWLLDQSGKVITDSTTDLSEVRAVRSVGTNQNETQRAIEAAVAATCFSSGCIEYDTSEGVDYYPGGSASTKVSVDLSTGTWFVVAGAEIKLAHSNSPCFQWRLRNTTDNVDLLGALDFSGPGGDTFECGSSSQYYGARSISTVYTISSGTKTIALQLGGHPSYPYYARRASITAVKID